MTLDDLLQLVQISKSEETDGGEAPLQDKDDGEAPSQDKDDDGEASEEYDDSEEENEEDKFREYLDSMGFPNMANFLTVERDFCYTAGSWSGGNLLVKMLNCGQHVGSKGGACRSIEDSCLEVPEECKEKMRRVAKAVGKDPNSVGWHLRSYDD